MWQLIQTHSCQLLRQRLLANKSYSIFINFVKSKPSEGIKRYISNKQVSTNKSAKDSLFHICSPWKLCSGISLGLGVRLLLNHSAVFCKAVPNSRVIQRRPNLNEDSSKFDWRKLFEYLWPHRWLLAAAVASALAVAFLNIYIPAMLGVIVNVLASMKANPNIDFIKEIKFPALKLISLYIGQAAFTFLYIHLLAQVGERVAAQMKQDLFMSILRQDMAFFDQERTGELVNRLTVDVQDFKSSFKQTISGGLRALTQMIGSAVSLLIISPHLTGLTMVCVPSVVIGGTFIGSLLRKLSREAQAQIEKATLVAEEAISNMRTVRAFAGEENEARMFAAECEAAADLNMELGLGVGLFQAGTNLFLNGMVLGTMFMGGHLMWAGHMSAGDVMAFLVNAQTVQRSVAQLSMLMVLGTMFMGGHLMWAGHVSAGDVSAGDVMAFLVLRADRAALCCLAVTTVHSGIIMVLGTMFMGGHLMWAGHVSAGDVMAFLVNAQTVQRSVAQLSLLFGSVVKGMSAGGRVFEYINKEPTMDTSGTKIIKHHEFCGDIEFKDVTFAYPTRPAATVLKNFNLKIPAGKMVAIVGASGNGKSTIAALVERFYDVNSGAVTIDGVDVREFDARWLRGRALGLISQEPVLFATSVRENIRYGKPEASDEEVMRAAMTANAHEFITGFPDGYDTMVGERGMSLSGGQKQRIAIARAVLKNPPIIILDEATSALDSASEKVVQGALESAAKGRTVMVIAHRLSTVINADLIVVLNRGKIVEMGTHDHLKKQKGFYWNLIKQQDHDNEDPSKL